MAAPDVAAISPLANGDNVVELDRYNLQHVRYPNVFSLGDVSGMPSFKTAAAYFANHGLRQDVHGRVQRQGRAGFVIPARSHQGAQACGL
jgi:NADPH-dependent 2,4-dienoyl-CoA reductase/sulfur reductase-like enzyme